MDGYIKLPKSLSEWEWFDDPNTLKVYIKLLFAAEFRDRRYKGCELKRGQLLTTIPKISALCGLSTQQTRTVLERLKATDKITVETTNKFSIITLVEYDCDLENNSQNNTQTTGKQQTTQQPINRLTLLQEENKELKNQENARVCEDEPPKETALDRRFSEFWAAYPKKVAKAAALKVWKRLKPSQELTDQMIAAIQKQKSSDQWTRERGRFIPNPATWLNGGRWEDEVTEVQNEINSGNIRRELTAEEYAEGFVLA